MTALRALNGEWFPDDIVDGFFEKLSAAGLSEEKFRLLLETGLLEGHEVAVDDREFTTVTQFNTTPQGQQAIEWMEMEEE